MRIERWMAAVASASVLLAAGSAWAAEKRPKVVVLNIKPIDEATEKIAATLTEILTTDLSKTGRYEVVSQSEIAALIGLETQKQLLGCGDEGCVASIGGALGCDYALLGSLGRVGDSLRIDLKIADSKRSKVTARDGAMVEKLDQLVPAGRRALVGVLAQLNGGTPPPELAARPEKAGPGVAPYVVLGVGGAALVAGGVLAAVTLAGKRDLYFDDARTRATAGMVVGGVGLAAVAAGAIWAAVGSSQPASGTVVGISPTAGGAALCAAGTF